MSAASRPRSASSLALVTLLALLWFAAMFFVAIPATLLWLAGASLVPAAGATRVLGGGVVAFALLVHGCQLVAFVRQGRGSQAPFDPPRELVAGGPYQWVRNPMYLLYTLVIAGEAILYRSRLLAAYTLVFWGLAHLYVVAVEEKQMRRRFGAAYEEYCRQVGRWLPRVGPLRRRD